MATNDVVILNGDDGDVIIVDEEVEGLTVDEMGPAGRDAYQLAVSKGYNGTLEDWLANQAGQDPGDVTLWFDNALV